MTLVGIILIAIFFGLVGGVVGSKIAKKKFYQPKKKSGGSSAGSRSVTQKRIV